MNGQEKDDEITGASGSTYNAMFWEYDARLGRRWNLDPVVKPYFTGYGAFGNNPILFVDPHGNDWFKNDKTGESKWNEAKGKQGEKAYLKGSKDSWTNLGEYFAKFESKRKNDQGANEGTLSLYKQDKIVAQTDEGFSGGVGTHPGIDAGYYKMRLDIRHNSDPVDVIATESDDQEPKATYGIETYKKGGLMTYLGQPGNSNKPVIDAYGTARIRLIPANELGNLVHDRGLYLHGKEAEGVMETHGCLCDKSQFVQSYFLMGGGKDFRGKVYLQVK